MRLFLVSALSLLLASSAFAVIGGENVRSSDPIAASTVAVDVIFDGFPPVPGEPPSPPPPSEIKLCDQLPKGFRPAKIFKHLRELKNGEAVWIAGS